ncbi:sodium-dependent transporter [Syntrophotalea acetylenica]|uniref:sodium-dependent transporter n=1 Tax=Syntrophotalea acetylenica TaxID=29542 RepID=UPI002A35E00E|nr:sodium-dependent transporter [Syntrophotalea acetylenica]MDY0262928.1 sodium-dependent transporter [Syntrophotalea acetylenica]
MDARSSTRKGWASRAGFVLAAAGSAIGLGNIWKFPYITGTYGGGAFVLVYLGCILLLGLPIMVAELIIGRCGQRDAIGSFLVLEGPDSRWKWVGAVSVVAAFLLLAFYSVVAGWSFDYVFKAASGEFSKGGTEQIGGLFLKLTASAFRGLFWQALFLAATAGIVIGGIRGGIERWSKILMPALFGLLILLFLHSMFSPGGMLALRFLFTPDFSLLTPRALLGALGHAFFTLSLGAGVMITYGSYLDAEADLFGLSFRIAALDTLVALLASLTIFSVVFSAGMPIDGGPGLVFKTLPILFLQLPFGKLLALLFFLLLAFAALTSAISMLEVVVAYAVDEWCWPRGRATGVVGLAAFFLGIPCGLSFNVLKGFALLPGHTVFESLDLLVSSYMLPLGGLMVAVYVGWRWTRDRQCSAFVNLHPEGRLFAAWRFVLRYFAPAAVLIILFNEAGWLG